MQDLWLLNECTYTYMDECMCAYMKSISFRKVSTLNMKKKDMKHKTYT